MTGTAQDTLMREGQEPIGQDGKPEATMPGGEQAALEAHGARRGYESGGRARFDEGAACGNYRQPELSPQEEREQLARLRDMSTSELGRRGEDVALQFLQRQGYVLRQRNWRNIAGEADLVMEDGDTTVLVEVKTRLALGGEQPVPEVAVDHRKFQKYQRMSLMYLAEHCIRRIRFDVVAINIVGVGHARLRHLIGAYGWEEIAEDDEVGPTPEALRQGQGSADEVTFPAQAPQGVPQDAASSLDGRYEDESYGL